MAAFCIVADTKYMQEGKRDGENVYGIKRLNKGNINGIINGKIKGRENLTTSRILYTYLTSFSTKTRTK